MEGWQLTGLVLWHG